MSPLFHESTTAGSGRAAPAAGAWYRTCSLRELRELAAIIAKSSLCPENFRGSADDVLVGLMMGAEVGLSPMQALQNISVIQGRPALWGDAMLAVCKQFPKFEYCHESFQGLMEDGTLTAICKVKRRGEPETVRTFSLRDAKTARLLGRGMWQTYPKRMLQMRARGFALRDVFPDVLRGLWVAEEAQDLDPAESAKGSGGQAHSVLPAPPSLNKVLEAIEGSRDARSLAAAVSGVSALTHPEKEQVRHAYRIKERHMGDGQSQEELRDAVRKKISENKLQKSKVLPDTPVR